MTLCSVRCDQSPQSMKYIYYVYMTQNDEKGADIAIKQPGLQILTCMSFYACMQHQASALVI